MELNQQQENFKKILFSYDENKQIYRRKHFLGQSKFELNEQWQLNTHKMLEAEAVEVKKNFSKYLLLSNLPFCERIQYNYSFSFKENGVKRHKKIITAFMVDIDQCHLGAQQLKQKAEEFNATCIIHSDIKPLSKQVIFQLDKPVIYDSYGSQARVIKEKVQYIQHFLNIHFFGDPLFVSHIAKNPLCYKTCNEKIICDHHAEWLEDSQPISFSKLFNQAESYFVEKKLTFQQVLQLKLKSRKSKVALEPTEEDFIYLANLANNKKITKNQNESIEISLEVSNDSEIIQSESISLKEKNEKIKSLHREHSEGRNVRTFDFLRQEAYVFRNRHTLDEICEKLPTYLYQLLDKYSEITEDLPQYEIDSIIRSIHQYCIQTKTNFLNHQTEGAAIPEWILRYNQKRELNKQHIINSLVECLGIEFFLKQVPFGVKEDIAEIFSISVKTVQRYLTQIRETHYQMNSDELTKYEKVYVLKILHEKQWDEIKKLLDLPETTRSLQNAFCKWKKKCLNSDKEEKLKNWVQKYPDRLLDEKKEKDKENK